jgi:hypothetical protein
MNTEQKCDQASSNAGRPSTFMREIAFFATLTIEEMPEPHLEPRSTAKKMHESHFFPR